MTELASEIIKEILAQTDENSNSIALRNDDSITGAIEKPGILPLNAALEREDFRNPVSKTKRSS